ncbi:hypothetical protein [Marinobacter zhejiangensis]|uniref:Extracellular solute-binding protein, family 3 n=1 Tax=Marinobacter zhejiangensis TaxID=488535 RepID=A0A1I4RYX5_9GAMM|nr:hypothetical protein [Marinobacter zhejiangensis]SFM57455.1 hypothetical protein SAMN04487963_3036 [Marinobacter zhejiangensis]
MAVRSGIGITAFSWLLFCGFVPGFAVGSETHVLHDQVLTNQDRPVRSYILWYRNFDSPAIYELVNLALSKTPEYGDYRIERSVEMVQGRALLELSKPHQTAIDIAAVATSVEREKELMAIPVPIDGGLLGFRVCVVSKAQVERFRGVETIADFAERGLRIGQGLHWPDSSILQVNGIEVIANARYETLFRMLRNQRFECFARGVSEVLFDLELENDPSLTVEPDLLLAYPMLSYFFVGPDDTEAAQRLQLGMDRAILDGSFAEFLDRFYGAALDELHLERRTLLVLDNPYLGQDSAEVGQRTLDELKARIGR